MISQERLDDLRFQVEHSGLTQVYYETLKKTNRLKSFPNAPMIMVSISELSKLLDKYEEKQE